MTYLPSTTRKTRQWRIADIAPCAQRTGRLHSQTPLCTARLTAEGCQSAGGNAEMGGTEATQLRPSLPCSRVAPHIYCVKHKKVKVKAFPYSMPSVGPGADPGVQAVSPQVTVSHPPGGRLPLLSARPAVTSPAAEHHRNQVILLGDRGT